VGLPATGPVSLPGARPWAVEVEVALQDERRLKMRLVDPEDAHEPGRPQGRRRPLRSWALRNRAVQG